MAAGSLLEDEARKIGLYAQAMNVGTSHDPNSNEHGEPVLIATFLLGDVAFSARVQDPEQAAVNDEFAKMESDVANDTLNTVEGLQALRDRLSKKKDDEDDDAAPHDPPEAE